jgi:hypothetical protein
MYEYLRQHPGVYMSPVKETNYYWYEGQAENRKSVKTRAEYEALFAGAAGQRAIGEASPQYLNSETAPDRIRADLPGARLIVSLRHPVDRAYSAYLGWLRNGRGTTPVREALRSGSPFVEHSRYFPRLSRYFERFPRAQIKIVRFDDFVADPPSVMRDLFAFVGVDPDVAVDTRTVHNAARVPRSPWLNLAMSRLSSLRRVMLRPVPALANGTGILTPLQRAMRVPTPPLPEDLRKTLQREFEDDIRRTAELTGIDLTSWVGGASPTGARPGAARE